MSIRSPNGALTSESSFDASPDSISFFTHISQWTEAISPSPLAGQDLFSQSDFQEMNGSDAFELKDTASVHSMDSAYQSQKGSSQRGTTMREGYQRAPAQDGRTHLSSQFDMYSPSLSSETFSTFAEPQNQMHLPPAAGAMEAGEGQFTCANFTTGQDYSPYSTSSAPRFTPGSEMPMSFQPWATADAQAFHSMPYSSYPQASQSIDATLFASHDPTEMMFNQPAPQQPQMRRPRVDTSVRPSMVRSSSSLTASHMSPQVSASEATFGSFVKSPTNVHVAHPTQFDQQHESRNEKEETASTSRATQSLVDEDEPVLDESDAAEAENMEAEHGKVARSHSLYQAGPDKDGKYHCPNEGKQGCNHKPTPLKCNYDKYVDSHLKPFRCNKDTCVGVQFSSTACLLRHEREAHGMHGHGSRPNLCYYQDCERAIPGHGFPRRYNLFDHMKRVHDYTGPSAEASPPTAQGQAPTTRKSNTRKRKSTADDGSERRQKQAKPNPQQLAQQRRAQLEQEWMSRRQRIIDIFTNLTKPSDVKDDIQLAVTDEIHRLREISAKLKESHGG